MTLKEIVCQGEHILKEAGIKDATEDARLLAMYAFDLDYSSFFLQINDDVSDEAAEWFMNYINLRSTHYPCQYIIGTANFMGYEFKVCEDVLIPRPETELLVEQAICLSEGKRPCKVLDLCCGSGCIGISYRKLRKEAGYEDYVMLADISKQAVSLADENAMRLGEQVDIVRSDLFGSVDERFDMIISNPPYIKTAVIDTLMEEVRDYEPVLALDGHEDGLYFYDRIIKEARDHLYDGGKLLFEIGHDQSEAVRRLFVDAGYEDIEQKKDYADLDRIVTAVWRNKHV
ncbi:MAG: peptide chain release factor N(5)-glutamine methyltransferase [Eubacteriales bacterium]|nr:peptide chain release factor N(5)-glutamine methyltransferase [Eubacteriales bacterium]